MTSFEADQWIQVELPTVFRFFSDPANLPVIMPAELHAQVVRIDRVPPTDPDVPSDLAGAGTIIVFSFRPIPFLPIRQKWVAEIVEFENLSYFRDVQRDGPFKMWDHRHEFVPETRNGKLGTLIRDRVKFEVGYGPFGGVAERLILRRRMQKTFSHRQAALEKALLNR